MIGQPTLSPTTVLSAPELADRAAKRWSTGLPRYIAFSLLEKYHPKRKTIIWLMMLFWRGPAARSSVRNSKLYVKLLVTSRRLSLYRLAQPFFVRISGHRTLEDETWIKLSATEDLYP